jgi:hypothetical protein
VIPDEIRVGGARAYFRQTKESVKHLVSNRETVAPVLIQIVLIRFWLTVQRPFAQPYLLSFGLRSENLGYFFAVFNVVSALAARFSHRMAKVFGNSERWLCGALIIGCVGVLSLFAFPGTGAFLIVSISAAYFIHGMMLPVILEGLNRRIDSDRRAACLSLSSMGNHVLGFVVGPLYGHASDTRGLVAGVRIFWSSYGLALIGLFVTTMLLIRKPSKANDDSPTR